MNQMTAVEVLDPTDRYTISGSGYELEGTVHHAAGSTRHDRRAILPYVIANDAKLVDGKVVGDPTEGALLVLGHKAGLDLDETRERHPRLATLPFDPTYKLMATFTRPRTRPPIVRCFVKGAAPAVIGRASTALSDGRSVPWDADLRSRAQANVERMGEEGCGSWRGRSATSTRPTFDPEATCSRTWRSSRSPASSGWSTRRARPPSRRWPMPRTRTSACGWSPGTTWSRAPPSPSRSASRARRSSERTSPRLDESERLARIDDIGVVGRVAPEHKVLLVETLKQKDDVVAMTGDGVNDAPSIKAAHIGIAMGSGTEVAKNAGRMILTDDNFSTIVRAVRQGRKLYDNLTKYVRFVLISLVAFVLTFLGATLLNIAAGQPFTPAQVLWIHFFISAPFGVALGLDQETPGLMLRRPRRSTESIMTRGVMLTPGSSGCHRHLLGRAHLLRHAALRPRHRVVDRTDCVRPDARRRGLRVPQPDRLRVDAGRLRQPAR